MHIRRVRRGFTLVEMLVVVAIIGVLLALVLPALAKGLRAGRKAVCVSNLRQLHAAAMNYANDHGGELPYARSMVLEKHDRDGIKKLSLRTGWIGWLENDRETDDKRTYWWGTKGVTCITNGTLFKYLGDEGDESVYVCPEHAKFVRKHQPYDCSGKAFKAGNTFPARAVRSYGMNSGVSVKSLLLMRGGSRTMLFAEQGYNGSQPGDFKAGYALRYVSKSKNSNDEWEDPEPKVGETTWRRFYRSWDAAIDARKDDAPCEAIGEMHSRNPQRPEGVAIFVDGHVETVYLTNTEHICSGNWGE